MGSVSSIIYLARDVVRGEGMRRDMSCFNSQKSHLHRVCPANAPPTSGPNPTPQAYALQVTSLLLELSSQSQVTNQWLQVSETKEATVAPNMIVHRKQTSEHTPLLQRHEVTKHNLSESCDSASTDALDCYVGVKERRGERAMWRMKMHSAEINLVLDINVASSS